MTRSARHPFLIFRPTKIPKTDFAPEFSVSYEDSRPKEWDHARRVITVTPRHPTTCKNSDQWGLFPSFLSTKAENSAILKGLKR